MEKKIKFLIVVVSLIGGFFFSKKNSEKLKFQEKIEITKNIEMISEFRKNLSGKVILAKEMDVDMDGNLESFIIYRENGKVWLTIGYNLGQKTVFTEAVPAPVEGQELSFNDFDGDGEIEFIVSGYKEEKVGYGVFKFSNCKIIDIFAEGMKECC